MKCRLQVNILCLKRESEGGSGEGSGCGHIGRQRLSEKGQLVSIVIMLNTLT